MAPWPSNLISQRVKLGPVIYGLWHHNWKVYSSCFASLPFKNV